MLYEKDLLTIIGEDLKVVLIFSLATKTTSELSKINKKNIILKFSKKI